MKDAICCALAMCSPIALVVLFVLQILRYVVISRYAMVDMSGYYDIKTRTHVLSYECLNVAGGGDWICHKRPEKFLVATFQTVEL